MKWSLVTDSVETVCVDSFSPITEDENVDADVPLSLETADSLLCWTRVGPTRNLVEMSSAWCLDEVVSEVHSALLGKGTHPQGEDQLVA